MTSAKGKGKTADGVRDPLRALDSAAAAYAPALPPIAFEMVAGNDYVQARIDGAAVRLSFCGTNDPQDWKSNLRAELIPFKGIGHVHKGFAEAWTKFEDGLRKRLKCLSGSPVFIEGHSRGGSIGTIAAAILGNYWEEFGQVEALTTFGAPMVGDKYFVEMVEKACRSISRYEVETLPLPGFRDPVPRVPPFPKYRPAGKRIRLFAVGKPSDLHAVGTYRKALVRRASK